jgi:hypothetical protein
VAKPSKPKLTSAWKRAAKRFGPPGSRFKDGDYELASIDEGKRFNFVRVATGSPVVITGRVLDRVWESTKDGGTLEYRTNGAKGISYTIANQYLVVLGLGLTLNAEKKWERKR